MREIVKEILDDTDLPLWFRWYCVLVLTYSAGVIVAFFVALAIHLILAAA